MPFIPLQDIDTTSKNKAKPEVSSKNSLGLTLSEESKSESEKIGKNAHGFTPIETKSEADKSIDWKPAFKTLEAIGQVYPAVETAANLASQAISMPVAGIAGLGAVATNAIGLTNADPTEVIQKTAGAMTYQPRTELGKHLTNATMYPFEKLAEAGNYAGSKTLDATGNPIAATAVDTAINALPMVVGAKASPKGTLERAADRYTEAVQPPVNEIQNNVHIPVETPVQTMPEVRPMDMTNHSAESSINPIDQTRHEGIVETPKITESIPNNNQIAIDNAAIDSPILPKEIETPTENNASTNLIDAETPIIDLQQDIATRNGSQSNEALTNEPVDVAGDKINKDWTAFNPDSGTLNIPREAIPQIKSEHRGAMVNFLNARDISHEKETVPASSLKPTQMEFSEEKVKKALGFKDENRSILVSSDNHVLDGHHQWLAKLHGDENIDIIRLNAPINQLLETVKEFPSATTANGAIASESVKVPEVLAVKEAMSKDDFEMNGIADARNSMSAGANYVDIGIDKIGTEGKLADNPIRREDVLIPFMKALDSTMYEGRVKGKNRLGFYIPKLEAVRIKNKSDLEVAAHEMAHLIDDRVPEISQSWQKGAQAKTFTDELRGVSYDKKKIYEGFAEFTRLYMTQPEQAMAKAPEFYKWFDGFTQRHEYGAAIRKAQEGMTSWFNQDALHRAQSKIGLQKSLNSGLDGVFDKFRQSTVDDLHGVMQMERKLTGKISPLGAYETSRNTRGAGAIIDGAIDIGAPVLKADGSFTFEGNGLKQALEPVAGELDNFLMYAVGRSSQELMMQGREHLFTKAEIKAMLQLEKPEYRKAFQDYQAWNKSVLDFAEAHGVVNGQIRQLFNRSQYLPFYRAGQAGAQKSAGGVTGNWSGIKKLTGGDENLRPILGNMTQNAAMLIEASLKNEARMKIVDLAKQKGGGKFMVKIEADSRPIKIDKAQVKDELLKSAGIDPTAARMGMLDAEQSKVANAIEAATEQGQGFFEFLINNQAPQGNVMAVLRNGKPEYYEIADPLLYRAVSSLNRPAQNWIVNLLGLPKRIGQAAITLTPDFMVANIARDTIMAATMSKAGFVPFVDSVRGMASRIAHDPAYKEFIANGGGFASYLRNEDSFRAHLERFYTKKGIDFKTVLDTPDKLLYGIETIADAFEMSSRLGEYKRMREQGAHPRHAAYVAREISTDFAMRGDSKELGFMYDTVMFLRPAVLSIDRLARGLTHDDNKGAIAAKAATIALMSVGLYMLNKDNPKYQDLEDWDRDGNWHFFVPRADGTTTHLRYPKIWEIGALASVAERTMATLSEHEPYWGKSVGHIMGNLFNLNFMPQIVAPLYEQATNKNGFTDSPIETPGMENMQPFLRAKSNTSETMKALGMATRNLPEGKQIAPARAEALLRGYFNTWAMYGLMITDSAFFNKNTPERRLDEMPVVRRFYEGSPAKHTKYENMFYDMLGEAQRLHGTIKALDRTSRSEIADDFADDPAASRYRQFERANRSLQDITKEMNEVVISTMTKQDKRLRLDELTTERNSLMKSVVLDNNTPDGAKQSISGFTPVN